MFTAKEGFRTRAVINDMKIVQYNWEEHKAAAEAFSRKIYYPNFWEDPKVFKTKLDLYPEGCFAYTAGGICVGYVFSHPWVKSRVVELGEDIVAIPDNSDTYYIHDLAVSPDFRGLNIGSYLACAVLDVAKKHGFKDVTLVSVLNSDPFWEKFGFVKIGKLIYGKFPAYVMVKSF